jgi:hypothetical protein
MFTGAEFKESASFNGAQIGEDSYFEGTTFINDVSFRNTSLRTFIFEELEAKFHAKIDLRGCIYDSILPVSFWEQLMEHLSPYDRQPFAQLEETFRRAGKDTLADDVYYKQKCREFREDNKIRKLDDIRIRKLGAWLMDRFLWLLTGYGVRLRRLVVAIALILLVGAFIFHLEGAVVPNPDIQMTPVLGSQVAPSFSYTEAFWVSLNTFLPVGIPSGADWKPSSESIVVLGIVLAIKFTTFATLLNLAGWILVPVGVAGISGLLKR